MGRQQGHVDALGVLFWSSGASCYLPLLPQHILDVFQPEYANFISKSPWDSKPGLFFKDNAVKVL